MDYPNKTLRTRLRYNGIPLWRVAQQLNVSELTVQRWLRVELDEQKRALFDEAIRTILAEREGTA